MRVEAEEMVELDRWYAVAFQRWGSNIQASSEDEVGKALAW